MRIPTELKQGPFTIEQARELGITRWQLEGPEWKRLRRSRYVWRRLLDNPDLLLDAALLRVPPEAAFSGLTAQWIRRLDVPFDPIVEVTIPQGLGVSNRAGLSVRRSQLPPSHVAWERGYRVTSSERTLRDLGARSSLTETVVQVDMSLYAGHTDLANLAAWVATNPRGLGIVNLRQALGYAEPKSESPMESRLRMLLLLAGLPRPLAQVTLRDEEDQFLGRPDLYYPEARLALEYDGQIHRESLAADNQRQNRLIAAGITLLRFTAADILNAPERVVALVRAMLARTLPSRRARLKLAG